MEHSYDPDDTILGYQDQGSPDTTDPETHDSPTAPPKPADAPEAGASTSGAMTRTRAKREHFVPEQPEYSKTSLEFNLNKKKKKGQLARFGEALRKALSPDHGEFSDSDSD